MVRGVCLLDERNLWITGHTQLIHLLRRLQWQPFNNHPISTRCASLGMDFCFSVLTPLPPLLCSYLLTCTGWLWTCIPVPPTQVSGVMCTHHDAWLWKSFWKLYNPLTGFHGVFPVKSLCGGTGMAPYSVCPTHLPGIASLLPTAGWLSAIMSVIFLSLDTDDWSGMASWANEALFLGPE